MSDPVVLHYGMGTNSLGMLCWLVERDERPDLILSADTQGEKPRTYESLKEVQDWLVKIGWPKINVVRYKTKFGEELSLEDDCLRRGTLPSIAFGFKTCSQRWKVRPQDYFLRDWPLAQETWKKGGKVIKLIGYDAGEERRAKPYSDEKFEVRYPLIKWGWDRDDCVAAIRRMGLKQPGKSACFFCPSSKKWEVAALEREHPELHARALKMEENAKPNVSVAGLGRRFSWADVPFDVRQIVEEPVQPELPCGCFTD